MLSKIRKAIKAGVITDQFSLSSPLRELTFSYKRSRGHLLGYLKNRFIWYYAPALNIETRFATHVDLEIASQCQLKCPMCYTTTDFFKSTINRTFMDFELYKKCVDECARHKVYSIRLSWRGEPLLHPNVIEMVEYAKKKGIPEVSFLSNAGKLDDRMIDGLIKAGLDWITVSFDGLGETYNHYRRPLKFDDTVAKLKRLQQRKKELNTLKPVLKVQTVWDAIADDPDAYYKFMSSIADEVAFNPVKDKHYYKEQDLTNMKPNYRCPRLWQRMYVSATGKIGVCLSDVFEDLTIADANEMSLYDAWHGEVFRTIREKHRKGEQFDYLICRRCQSCLKRTDTVVEVDGRRVDATKYEHS